MKKHINDTGVECVDLRGRVLTFVCSKLTLQYIRLTCDPRPGLCTLTLKLFFWKAHAGAPILTGTRTASTCRLLTRPTHVFRLTLAHWYQLSSIIGQNKVIGGCKVQLIVDNDSRDADTITGAVKVVTKVKSDAAYNDSCFSFDGTFVVTEKLFQVSVDRPIAVHHHKIQINLNSCKTKESTFKASFREIIEMIRRQIILVLGLRLWPHGKKLLLL